MPQFSTVSDIFDEARGWQWRVTRASLGTTTGLIVLLVVVYLLFYDIEAFWNRAWSSPRSRSLLSWPPSMEQPSASSSASRMRVICLPLSLRASRRP